jgi:nicotinamidase-related amidase
MKASKIRQIAGAIAIAVTTVGTPALAAAATAAQQPGHAKESREIITRDNAAVIFIDHQPQTIFGIASHDRQTIINNTEALAKTAKAFGLPVVLTTVAAESFTGPLIPELRRLFPAHDVIDRSALNAWADERFVQAVQKTGRKKLIFAGTWTELCLALPVLSALEAGYEVYLVADASGGSSVEAHQLGIQRMVQAGARPMTWIGVISELQYDWARKDTYDAVNDIVTQHAGAWGAGVNFVRAMKRAGSSN